MSKTEKAFAFDGVTAFTPEAMKDQYEKFAKGFSAFADLNKDATEAAMTSAGVMATGVEKAASVQASFVKEAYEGGLAAMKAVGSSKDIQEAVEIQTEFARGQFEKNLGLATSLVDHWTTVVREASAPLTKRYAEFVEKAQTFRP
jgi:phasin family protein